MRVMFVLAQLVLPIAAAMAAPPSPVPSPRLDDVLVSPADPKFVDDPPGLPLPARFFTASEWVDSLPAKPSDAAEHLSTAGFVGGYAKAWIDRSTGHALVKGVAAFAGASGAEDFLNFVRWLPYPGYQHELTVSGLTSAMGAHYLDPATHRYSDYVAAFKGNDYLFVTLTSAADDTDDIASKEAVHQWDAAPAYTIPPAQWPENAPPPGSNGGGGAPLLALLLYFGVPALFLGPVLFIYLRSLRDPVLNAARRRPAMSGRLAAQVARATGAMPTARSNPAFSEIQMSPDGSQWWDGETWRDASLEVPPSATLSADGSEWWDGSRWRPVPGARDQ